MSFNFYTNSMSKYIVERRVRPGLCLSPEPGLFLKNVFRLRGNLCFMILKNHKIIGNFFDRARSLLLCEGFL